MKVRKIASLTAFISFLLLILNSVVLYIVPHGRIAYWADWRFWGLTKTEWTNQHVIIGVLFLLAIFLHTYYNWNPIVAYLKNKARQIRVFTLEFNFALALTIVFTVGAYVEVAPFSWILNLSESVKNASTEKYGEPPYGRAEISTLAAFSSKMGLDLASSVARLKSAGIDLGHEKLTLLEIADLNKTSPQQLYLLMKPEEKPGATKALPVEPQQGLGKRSLSDICREYDLDISVVLKALSEQNLTATPDATIKQIAEKYGLSSGDVYAVITKAADQKR